MNKFKENDQVKIINAFSPFHDKTGKVASISHSIVFVKFEGSHGQPIGFDYAYVVDAPLPKVDDLVRIIKPTGKWTGQEGHVASVSKSEIRVHLDYDSVPFEPRHVEVIESFGPRRVEGQPISFGDVKEGDTIKTQIVKEKNGIVYNTFATGVVGAIGTRAKALSTREGGTLFGTGYDAIVLIKDVTKDQILSDLFDLPIDSVIEYIASDLGTPRTLWLAVRVSETTWRLLSPSGIANVVRTQTLRGYLKRDASDLYSVIRKGH